MNRHSPWFHGLVIAVLVTTAACAGDDDGGSTSGATAPSTATSTPAPTSTPTSSGETSPTEPATSTPGPDTAPASTAPADEGQCPTTALPDEGDPVEVEFWHSMSATTGVVIEQLIDDYNASQSRVHVTPVYQGGYADTFSKYVNTVRTGGELPALVQLSEIYMQQMVDSQTIVPVDDCIASASYDLSDFSDFLLDQYRLDGRLVTMPFQLANLVLFYDGTDFTAAGLDPAAAPATLDELVATSRTLVDAGAAAAGISLGINAWPFEQWVATAGETLVDHDNGRSGRAEHARLDTQTVTDLLATLQGMHDDGLLLVGGRGGEQAALAPFIAIAQGEASMTIASSATLGEIYEQIYQVPDVEVRVGPFPGAGGKTTIGGGSIYLTNATDDAERAAAWDLLAWLNEPEQQVQWSIGTGYVPTRTSAVDDPDLVQLWNERPGFRVAWDQLAVGGEVPGGGGPVIGDYPGVRDAILDGLEALFDGVDVATVQADMQDAADAAIADYNERIGS
jgi:sn-glycerol 3-phosphate transport system substrate-binding protein